jgi:hypothetical protein
VTVCFSVASSFDTFVNASRMTPRVDLPKAWLSRTAFRPARSARIRCAIANTAGSSFARFTLKPLSMRDCVVPRSRLMLASDRMAAIATALVLMEVMGSVL